MDERKKKIQEGEQRENEIYDLIYALIGNDTPESDCDRFKKPEGDNEKNSCQIL